MKKKLYDTYIKGKNNNQFNNTVTWKIQKTTPDFGIQKLENIFYDFAEIIFLAQFWFLSNGKYIYLYIIVKYCEYPSDRNSFHLRHS